MTACLFEAKTGTPRAALISSRSFANRPVAADRVTTYGVCAALSVVALVLTFLVTASFFVGILLRKPMLSAVVLVFVWLPVNLVLHTFSLEEFSPLSLCQALPTLLRTPWKAENDDQAADLSAMDVAALARKANRYLSVFSGGPPPPPEGWSERREG